MTAAQFSAGSTGQRIRVNGPLAEDHDRILTPEALRFVADLEQRFGQRRQQLLGLRADRQRRFNEGVLPAFRLETAELRNSEWRVKQTPADFRDRRVELAGPVDRDSVLNAFRSGASCYIMDFEDNHAPTWNGTLEGQLNLYDAVRDNTCGGRAMGLVMRPRAWHLTEPHLEVNSTPVSASLFDFGLFIYHNGLQLLEQGSTPAFHLPKLESYIEAQLWNDLFAYAEESLGLNPGCICCTLGIETLPAAFEMDEMLYALRDYAIGLDFGRRNYVFSFIKRFQADADRVLPDRRQLGHDGSFIQACSDLLIETCQRRGAHASSAIATQQPGDDDSASRLQTELAQRLAEGYNSIRLTQAGLVQPAIAAFEHCPAQTDHQPADAQAGVAGLLQVPSGSITRAGFSDHISLALHYLAGWLGGRGAVTIDRVAVNGASAELARAQIWQWIQHPQGVMEDDQEITIDLFRQVLDQELAQLRQRLGETGLVTGHYLAAADLLAELVDTNHFIEFFTLPAYQTLA